MQMTNRFKTWGGLCATLAFAAIAGFGVSPAWSADKPAAGAQMPKLGWAKVCHEAKDAMPKGCVIAYDALNQLGEPFFFRPVEIRTIEGKDSEVTMRLPYVVVMPGQAIDRKTGKPIIDEKTKQPKVVAAPAEVNWLSAPGARIKFDDEDAKATSKLDYILCNRLFCAARMKMDQAFLDKAKKAKVANLIGFFDVNEKGLVAHAFPLPMEEFGKVFDGQPTTEEEIAKRRKEVEVAINEQIQAARAAMAEKAKDAAEKDKK